MPVANQSSILLREPALLIPGRQPVGPVRLDKTHPLSRGLVSVCIPGVSLQDFVDGAEFVNYSTPLDPVAGHGIAANTEGGEVNLRSSNRSLGIGTGHFTWTLKLKTPVSFTNYDYCAGMGNYNPGMFSYHSSYGSWGFYGSTPSGHALSADAVYMLTAKRHGGGVDYFTNGIFDQTGAWDGNIADGALHYGSASPGAYYGNNSIFFGFLHNRALDDEEIYSLHRDPYQLLVPA